MSDGALSLAEIEALLAGIRSTSEELVEFEKRKREAKRKADEMAELKRIEKERCEALQRKMREECWLPE